MVSHEGMTEHGDEVIPLQVSKIFLYSFDNHAASICIVSLQSINFLLSLGKSLCNALIPCYAGLLEVRHTKILAKSELALGNFDCAKQASKGEIATAVGVLDCEFINKM